jgi:ATP-dependent metalloprotease
MLARAIAGEAGVPFFQSSGSEFNDKYLVVAVLKSMLAEVRANLYESRGSELDEKYVGYGARKVRDLFAAAKKQSPCVIFIDEIDAVDGSRNHKDFKWETLNQWAVNFKRQPLGQLLYELFQLRIGNKAILVIGATNFPESLDRNLVRPRQFDRRVVIDNPDVEGPRHILESHMTKVFFFSSGILSCILAWMAQEFFEACVQCFHYINAKPILGV